MGDFFRYIIELNIVFTILYITYRILFFKDRNFIMRRFFLLAILGLAILLPLTPSLSLSNMPGMIPAFSLEEITVYGESTGSSAVPRISFLLILTITYFTVVFSGLVRFGTQLSKVFAAIRRSEKNSINGHVVLSSRLLHASSFFNYIFIDLYNNRQDSVHHILDHEIIHRNEKHSIDRILTEIAVLLCWFNPFIWFYKKSVIENHEYLADSAVITGGTNIIKYQMSILNQYIESASITNQFSSHIKKRIKMLNTTYRMGSKWKVAILFPVVILAFFLISCADQKEEAQPTEQIEEPISQTEDIQLQTPELFYIVEEMPTFNGGEPIEFRKYIAQNIKYPAEAVAKGVSGKVFVKFIVTSEGKVLVPDKELLASLEGQSIDEVVVVSYRPINEDSPEPDKKYIDLLTKEAVRVVSSSPDWEPGKQRGKSVNVLFTFPINFVLQ